MRKLNAEELTINQTMRNDPLLKNVGDIRHQMGIKFLWKRMKTEDVFRML